MNKTEYRKKSIKVLKTLADMDVVEAIISCVRRDIDAEHYMNSLVDIAENEEIPATKRVLAANRLFELSNDAKDNIKRSDLDIDVFI